MGTERLAAYGQEHADEFGGLYIDTPRGQHVVMLFTGNLEAHARAVDAIVPGTTVRGVRYTDAELTAAIASIDEEELLAEGVEFVGAYVDTINNRVVLEAKSDDPTAELRLELSFGGLLEVTMHPAPGEWHHIAEGDGWRLIGAERAAHAEAFTVRAATDTDQLREMWRDIGLEDDPPPVDFDDEVVATFGHAFGSTCPEVRFDGVAIDGGVVYSAASDPLAPRICTADLAGAAVFLVTLSRDALPDHGFTLRLWEESVRCPACGDAEVEVSLP